MTSSSPACARMGSCVRRRAQGVQCCVSVMEATLSSKVRKLFGLVNLLGNKIVVCSTKQKRREEREERKKKEEKREEEEEEERRKDN